MSRMRRRRGAGPSSAALLLVAVAVVSACGSSAIRLRDSRPPTAGLSPARTSEAPSSASVILTPPSAPASSSPAFTVPPAPAPSPRSTAIAHGQPLDIGGRTILPGHRIVADYGAAGGPGLGVLGAGTPAQAAADVQRRVAAYASYGEPVVGAMELLATVALGGPGPTGQYTSLPDLDAISAYLAAAKQAHELLILDLQPGRASFYQQVQEIRSVLLDPNVSVALDPEWKVGPDQTPGHGFIGSSGSADINAVGSYLAQLVRQNGLPQKLLVIHQFALSMLPDRAAIVSPPGLAVVFHADGEGSVPAKLNTYAALAFPGPPFYAGFKLFLTQDPVLMTPAQVMALRRRPDLVTYQ